MLRACRIAPNAVLRRHFLPQKLGLLRVADDAIPVNSCERATTRTDRDLNHLNHPNHIPDTVDPVFAVLGCRAGSVYRVQIQLWKNLLDDADRTGPSR